MQHPRTLFAVLRGTLRPTLDSELRDGLTRLRLKSEEAP
jgi:hypothetical protein